MSPTHLSTSDLNSVNGVINNLLYITPTRHLLYVTDKTNGFASHKFEHLSCFFPGLLALSVHALSTSPTTDSTSYTEETKQLHLWAAQGLAETCWILYHDQKTGLGPDEVRMLDFGSWSRSYGEKDSQTLEEKDGLWVTQIEKWRKGGEKGGVPPGVPESGKKVEKVDEDTEEGREYRTMKPEYLLRPEVRDFPSPAYTKY